MVTTSTKNKLTQTLATGAAALGVALVAGAGAANAGTIKLTPTQTASFGPAQTDYNTTLTFKQFNQATDVVLGPDEFFGSFNSVHLSGTISGISGPGSIFCQTPGGGGTCQGSASASLTGTLKLGTTTISNIPILLLPLTSYSIPQGGTFIIPETTGSILFAFDIDLKQQIGNPALLAQFAGTGTIGLDFTADGTFNAGTTSGFTLSGNPIVASINAQLYYDYHVEPIPEPLTMLGVGTAVGFGAFFKRKLNQKSKQDSDKA